jgi:outer membrane usher protein
MPARLISPLRWLPARNHPVARVAQLVAAAGAVFAVVAGPAWADQALLLEVVVNGNATGKIGEFVQRDSELLARPAELRELGFRVSEPAPSTESDLVPLATLSGLTFRLDQTAQTLYVTGGGDRLLPQLLEMAGPAGSNIPVESGTGLALDYDVIGTAVAHRNGGSGLFDMRDFSPWGVASSGLLAYAGANLNGPRPYSAIRLDSAYVYSDADSLRRYRLGDYINGGLGWTRPVRLGGAQIQSDFSMRPDLVTFPLPVVSGSAAVPSTVDVLVNGSRLLSRSVQPGAFEIPQLPVVTGAGSIAMSVTNALGQQVTTTLPFYASSNLLASGLQTYSAEIGAVRRNWSLVSNDYGALAGSATYRRGLSPMLTLEAHGEGTTGLAVGGAGAVVNLDNLGVLNFSAAGSGLSQPGAQFTFGFQRIGPVVSLGAFASVANRNFRDLAAVNGDPVPRRQLNAFASLSFGRFGSAGVAFAGIDRNLASPAVTFFAPGGGLIGQGTPLPGGTVSTANGLAPFLPLQRARLVSANYSLQIGNLSFFATGFQDFAKGGGKGVMLGLTIPIGPRSSAGSSVGSGTGGGYAQVQATQSPVLIGDWGYQVYGAAGTSNHEFGLVQYKSPWGLVSTGADRVGNQTAGHAEAQGAVSFADGGLFASNTINDAFAVVDTGGAEGIRVSNENREVGRTDSAGRLLVPDLRSYDINRLSIDPTDAAADATVAFATRDVRPQDRSGVVVRFPVHASHGALLRLVDEAGRPLPVGSVATLAATRAAVPVGYDGEAYVQDLDRRNKLTVERPDGRRCAVSFEFRPVSGEIPTLGPLACRESQP